MLKVKMLFVGPSEAGKSVLANFLSESTEGIGSYLPTHAVRIETCWPALMKDSHGVVIVFNQDSPTHLEEIEMWHSCFVQQQQLLDSQYLLILHHKPGSAMDSENLTLPPPLNRLQVVHSSLEKEPEDVWMEFVKYLKGITKLVNENRDREEVLLIT
nr:intraflagellar transport protein 22 homolog isoform X2 [Zootoca vivipara]